MADPIPIPDPEATIDWAAVRVEARTHVRRQLGRVDVDTLEDLTQQVVVLLLRVVRREPVVHLSGLIRTIARAAAIDWIQKQVRRRKWLERLGEQDAPATARPVVDPLDLMWFTMLEFFRIRNTPCRDLLLAYGEHGAWQDVGEAIGTTSGTARKRWSRCLEVFRDALRKDPGTLADWMDSNG